MGSKILLAVAALRFLLINLARGGAFDGEKTVSPQGLPPLNPVNNLDGSKRELYTG